MGDDLVERLKRHALSNSEAQEIATALQQQRREIEELREALKRADLELLGAHMVLEGKITNATGALAKTEWRPDRCHIEGMRNTMKEALDYVADARKALLSTPDNLKGGG